MTRPIPSGWYPEPSGAGGMRYWDGIGWTCHRAGQAPAIGAPPVSGMAGSNHLPHLMIAIFTAGLWLPVWLVLRSVQRRREEMVAIAARADEQHQAVLRGDDEWGVFGQRPPTPPGLPSYTPITAAPGTLSKTDHKWVMAGCAIAAGVVLFAALITVNAATADRTAGTMRASGITNHPMAPPHQGRTAPVPQAPGQRAPVLTVPAIPFPFPFPFPVPSATDSPHPPTGVPVKVGEQAIDGQFAFVVTSFDRSRTVAGPIAPSPQLSAKGIFVNAHVTISNTGTQPDVFFAANQKFEVTGNVLSVDAAVALLTMTTAVVVSPGASVAVALSFDLPTDTPPGGMLELHGSSTSRGVDVALPPLN